MLDWSLLMDLIMNNESQSPRTTSAEAHGTTSAEAPWMTSAKALGTTSAEAPGMSSSIKFLCCTTCVHCCRCSSYVAPHVFTVLN